MIAMKANARFNGTKKGMLLEFSKDMRRVEMHMRRGKIRAYVDEKLALMWALRVKDAIKIALTQNDSDLGATLIIAKAIYSVNDGLEVLPHSWPETRFGHVIQTSQPFKPMVVGLALVDAKLVLDGIKSTENFCLHDQHCFEHSLCVVFSHVVFLLLVDGVATTTVAGSGVAFYSRTSSRLPEANQPSFVGLNECLVIRLRQCLQVHIRHVNGHFCQRECRQLVNQRKGKIVAGEAGGNTRRPVVGFDGAGYQYVSIRGEEERCPLVGVTPVVAITSNDKLPKGVNQHFVQCFDVFHARLWQVAVFPLLLLEMIPALVVGGLVQRFPLIPSLEATNIAMLGSFAQFLFGLRCEVQP